MRELRSFKHDETVPSGSLVWWKEDEDTHRSPLRLGRVIGSNDCFLIVQIGPDRYSQIVCRPAWSFYEVEPLEEPSSEDAEQRTGSGG